MEKAYSTLQISKENKDRLAKFGQKDESYDQIIEKLIDLVEINYGSCN